MMEWLGLDVGGANLKIADGLGYAATVFFPLWQRADDLAAALRTLIASAPSADGVAITMTGELADCFRTKAEGVAHILRAVNDAATGRRVAVYLTSGEFVSFEAALEMPLAAAASNWHALACFAGYHAPQGNALLIDIGSTTSDLIPLVDGRPVTIGKTDPARLVAGELVYTGSERSPLCAIVGSLPWRGAACPTAQEHFATSRDAYILLGEMPEDPADTHTADGRSATKQHAWDRVARSICADREMFDFNDALNAARAVRNAQMELISRAAAQVVARLAGGVQTVVLSGQGEFLARCVAQRVVADAAMVSLTKLLGAPLSRCATAHAVAVLARGEAAHERQIRRC